MTGRPDAAMGENTDRPVVFIAAEAMFSGECGHPGSFEFVSQAEFAVRPEEGLHIAIHQRLSPRSAD